MHEAGRVFNLLMFRIGGGARCSFQVTLKLGITAHGDGLRRCGVEILPAMVCNDFAEIVGAGDLDIPARLENIDAVELCKQAKLIERYLEVFTDSGDGRPAVSFSGSGDGKVIHLTE